MRDFCVGVRHCMHKISRREDYRPSCFLNFQEEERIFGMIWVGVHSWKIVFNSPFEDFQSCFCLELLKNPQEVCDGLCAEHDELIRFEGSSGGEKEECKQRLI